MPGCSARPAGFGIILEAAGPAAPGHPGGREPDSKRGALHPGGLQPLRHHRPRRLASGPPGRAHQAVRDALPGGDAGQPFLCGAADSGFWRFYYVGIAPSTSNITLVLLPVLRKTSGYRHKISVQTLKTLLAKRTKALQGR